MRAASERGRLFPFYIMPDPQPKPSAVNPSPIVWEDGAPRSQVHGDVYFSRDGGLAESRAVFLTGCGLPVAWAGRRRFVVGELGFGTGLNIAALLELWSRTRDPGSRLHVFTIEANPLDSTDAARALSAWPELASIATLITARWPGQARGFHRIDLPELGAVVDVAIMEAGEALEQWSGAADAWFLDGFAPALNPDIWRDEVIALIADRSAPGCRAATYTVAGTVRRALAAAGFAVERCPGHGRKRERLEARLAGAVSEPNSPSVAIVGAGIGGAALARAFGDLGVEAQVFDARGSGAGGSGAPAGLMAPRLDAGLGPAAALFAQASRRAARLYETTPGALISHEALQLGVGPKDPGRFEAIAGSDLFEPGAMRRATAGEASQRLGEAVGDGLLIDQALVVRPAAILAVWLERWTRADIASLVRADGVWRLLDGGGAEIARADVVCLANAAAAADLAAGLKLTPVRGQVTFTKAARWPLATIFGAYVIPTADGLLFGATHDRDETDPATRPEDRRRNLAAVEEVLPDLARRLSESALQDWTAVRATTRDYFPLAGAVPEAEPGIMVLTGLGSRGFCLAPLLAEHLAAGIMGAPSPLPRALAALVEPGRFAARASRKGRPKIRVKPNPS